MKLSHPTRTSSNGRAPPAAFSPPAPRRPSPPPSGDASSAAHSPAPSAQSPPRLRGQEPSTNSGRFKPLSREDRAAEKECHVVSTRVIVSPRLHGPGMRGSQRTDANADRWLAPTARCVSMLPRTRRYRRCHRQFAVLSPVRLPLLRGACLRSSPDRTRSTCTRTQEARQQDEQQRTHVPNSITSAAQSLGGKPR